MGTQRLMVGIVIILRLFTSIDPAALGAVDACTPAAGEELFTDQALALSSLTVSRPLLILAGALKAHLNKTLLTRRAPRTDLGNDSTSTVRRPLPTNSISAGFSPSQLRGLRTWRLSDASFLTNWIEKEYPGHTSMAEIILQTAHHMLHGHNSLKSVILRDPNGGEGFLKWAFEPPRAVHWWMAEVRNPHHYWLGGPGGDLLALDVVLFLQQLQTLGEARDSAGRIVATLADTSGTPYPYLVAEYMLHERLEESPLVHDAVIALTTKGFGYGAYYLQGGQREPGQAPAGTRVFTRPGQTPLGRALRSFIQWRFAESVTQLVGHLVVTSFYEPSKRAVLSARGMATGVRSVDAALLILQQAGETAIPMRNIVGIKEFDEVETTELFLGLDDVGLDKIVQLLQAGQQIDLWEAQVRSGIRSWPGDHVLCKIFQSLLTARDREGTRVYLGRRLDLKGVAEALLWARELGEALFALNLRLVVNHVVFGSRGPLFFNYRGMPKPYEYGDEEECREIVECLLRTIVSFATVTLLPNQGAGRRSQTGTQQMLGSGNIPPMKMSAKAVPLSRSA